MKKVLAFYLKYFIQFYFILLLSAIVFSAYGQTDTTFWFAAPEVSQTAPQNLDRPIKLQLTTGGEAAVVTISQPATTSGMPTQIVSIAANSTRTVDLTTWIDIIESKPANTVLDYGLKIVATAPITAYYESANIENPEAFILKGHNASGTDFWIPSQNLVRNNPSGFPKPYSSFDIVATEDSTIVTITPSNPIIGHPANIPFTVNLNRGQTYSAAAVRYNASDHLPGSRVISNKPIAITVKDDLLNEESIFEGTCGDLGGDQIIPTSLIGKEYIAMNGLLFGPKDQLFITATQNATTISQNGNYVTSINAGQTYRLPVGGASSYIKTSEPAYVWQLSGMGCEMGLGILPTINCSGSTSVSFVRSTPRLLYLNIMVKNGGEGNFLVNGNAGVITAAAFSAVPGTNGQWYAAQISLPAARYPQASTISVSNTTALFHLGVLDGGSSGGTSYGYFSNFNNVVAHAHVSSDSICAGPAIYLYADTVASATYNWTGPNNFSSNQQNPVITRTTAANSGDYVLTVSSSKCDAALSTVNLKLFDSPKVDLGNDTAICADTVVLQSDSHYTDPRYIWSTNDTISFIKIAQGGTYWLQVTDNGCTASDTVAVGIYEPVIPDFNYSLQPGCDQDTVLFTNLTTDAFNYYWHFGDGSETVIQSPQHIYENQGIYDVTLIADDSRCVDSVSKTVAINHSIIADFIIDKDSICAGDSILVISTATGTKPLAYSWDFGNGTTGDIQSPIVKYITQGIYTIVHIVHDSIQCVDTVSKTIKVFESTIDSFAISDSVICEGQLIQLGAHFSEGCNSIIWDFGDSSQINDVRDVSHRFDTSGNFIITLTANHIICPSTTVYKNLAVLPFPAIDLGPDTSICPYALQPIILGGKQVYPDVKYLWNTGDTMGIITVRHQGIYGLTATYLQKCSTSDSIEVLKSCYIDIPNVFTPDGDGLNDYFLPRSLLSKQLTKFSMQVFNKWGQLIFNTKSINGRGWNGKFNDTDQPQGVYVYIIEAVLANERTERYEGNVTLIR